jgi:hypothetical protein
MKCPKHNPNDLIKNVNTGVEYEYGVACALMSQEQYRSFQEEVLRHHPLEQKIKQVYKLVLPHFSDMRGTNRYISLAGTQDDSLGPSDVLICQDGQIVCGFSIKFNNRNNWNPSARNFIAETTINRLKELYVDKYLPSFIQDMSTRFGRCEQMQGTKNTWSRKRSSVTDAFIDLIRDEVIHAWSEKTTADKQRIIGSGFQIYSPIKYYVLNFKNIGEFDLSPPKPAIPSVEDIAVGKIKSSYVSFGVNGKPLVKLQVKFNNGFLEKSPDRSHATMQVGDCFFRHGDPFNSWNFNLI